MLRVDALTVLWLFKSDSWKMCIPRESVMLSATARTRRAPIIGVRGAGLPLRLTMKARLVAMAEVAPKLYLVRWVIESEWEAVLIIIQQEVVTVVGVCFLGLGWGFMLGGGTRDWPKGRDLRSGHLW